MLGLAGVLASLASCGRVYAGGDADRIPLSDPKQAPASTGGSLLAPSGIHANPDAGTQARP